MKQTGQAQEESKPHQQGISGFISSLSSGFYLARGISKAVLNSSLAR